MSACATAPKQRLHSDIPAFFRGHPFGRRVTSRQEQNQLSMHHLRHCLLCELEQVVDLDEKQRGGAAQLLGEAVNNAFLYGEQGGNVNVFIFVAPLHFLLLLGNPSHGYAGSVNQYHPGLDTHGCGRILMDGLVRELRESGLKVDYRYGYRPRSHAIGRTILKLEIRL